MKNPTKKQVALTFLLIMCTALFVFLFFKCAYSPVNFLKAGISLSEPILFKALLVQLYFGFLLGLIVWLSVLSFKNNVPYSSKRRIVLIVLSITCAILLILSIWFLLDNFINVTLKTLNEYQHDYPNHPVIQEAKKAIPTNICYFISILIFYSIFLLLAISFMRPPKLEKLNDNSAAAK